MPDRYDTFYAKDCASFNFDFSKSLFYKNQKARFVSIFDHKIFFSKIILEGVMSSENCSDTSYTPCIFSCFSVTNCPRIR